MNRQELLERAGQLRERQAATPCRVLVYCSTPCLSSGAGEVRTALEAEAAVHGGRVTLKVTGTGCLGTCSRGPVVTIRRPGQADDRGKHTRALPAPALPPGAAPR